MMVFVRVCVCGWVGVYVCVENGTKTRRLPVIYERGGGERVNGCLTLCQHFPESETETVSLCGQKVAARAYQMMKL